MKFAILVLALGMACAAPTTRRLQVTEVSKAINAFGFDFLRSIAKESAKNHFFSAPSMSIAFGMLAAGAAGGTLEDLKATFRHELINGDVHSEFGKLLEHLAPREASNTSYEFNLANKIYVSKAVRLLEQFNTTLRDNYKSAVESADFARFAVQVTADINSWVNNQTRGKISSILSRPLPSSTVMVLLNALYFKGQWMDKFEEKSTRPDTFYGTKSNSTVRFMTKKMIVESAEVGDATLVRLPYKGNASMILIAPTDERGNLTKVLQSISHESINSARFRELEAYVELPKFKLEVLYDDLLERLAKLGLRHLDDLSAMTSSGGIFVSDAMHKAVIEVNEEGSEAAAVTAIAVSRGMSRSRYFTFNRPFAFVIRDDLTNVHLFTGRVNQL